VSGCLECAIDHHLACPLLGEADDGFDADEDGRYSVHCCCGLAVDSRQTVDAEYAEYAEELRRRGWSQPTDSGLHLGEGSG
jgi:hypothetical protein